MVSEKTKVNTGMSSLGSSPLALNQSLSIPRGNWTEPINIDELNLQKRYCEFRLVNLNPNPVKRFDSALAGDRMWWPNTRLHYTILSLCTIV